MKINEILAKKRTLSFEVFPPKKNDENCDKLLRTIDELKELNPDFISVTYGALGSNSKNTSRIAGYIKNEAGIEPLAHITAGPSSYEDIDRLLEEYRALNIENVLALRGDKPIDADIEYCKYFKHATDLQEYMKGKGFNIAAACYPEGHQECDSLYEDLKYMKMKEDLGATFFITQVFYDNSYYYRLVNEARRIGIKSPIIPGIMPYARNSNLKKVQKMCGSTIPLDFRNMVERYKDNPILLEEIGFNYAAYQIIDLIAKGAPGVHLYTMNNARVAKEVCKRIENVIKELFKA